MSTPTEPELRTLFATVAPPSTLERRWRDAAVVGYHVHAPVRLRLLVAACVAAVLFTGGVVVGKLGLLAPLAPERTPSSTEPATGDGSLPPPAPSAGPESPAS